MIIKNGSFQKEFRESMRGGDGTIEITHLAQKEKLVNARLLANIKIPAGGSIGDHQHNEETEYYIILKGEGVVLDDGVEKKVDAGDIVVTGNGASHSIRNSGQEDLEMIAVIITY